MYNYKNRDEIPEKYKWDLSEYFKNEKEFNESLKLTTKIVEELKDYKDCTKDANKIYEYLNKKINAYSLVQNLDAYAQLKNDEFLGVKENIERQHKAENLISEYEKNTSFFEPEILKLNKESYEKLFKNCKKLLEFKPNLDQIYRKKEHIIPENEENIISELTNAMNNFESISSNLLNKEHNYKTVLINKEKVTITTNNYYNLMENKDRNIRKKAYNLFNKKLSEYSSTSSSLLNSYIKSNNVIAKLHKYKNAWDKKLFTLNMSDKVFKTLVKTVEENTLSITNYYSLKKKILKLNKIYPYDLKVSLTDFDKEYTIEEAQKLIKEALKPLGEEYLKKLTNIFDSRYIDYCGYKGKCSGGYSLGTLTKNSRILMSYNNTLNSVSIIAHECGHNIHHQYLFENNPLIYRSKSTIVCEVASLTNECLLSEYLNKKSKSKEEKLKGLENMMKVIESNLFGAVREGKLEEIMYDKINNNGSITKELMNELTENSLKKYYGNIVTYDDKIKNSWITRSHYYYNFYLYSYAICICVAIKIAKELINGNKEMINKYIKFLSTGSDVEIIDTFKILDIDLEDKEIYNSGIKYFDNLVTMYENIYFDKEVK